MALADTIVKDNRIPPRGFTNAAFEAGGAPPVGAVYADGQYWSDSRFAVPAGAVRAEAEIYYQNTPRHYIEALRDGNVTDDWGETLADLWNATGRGAPIEIARRAIPLGVEAIFADGFESGYTTAWSAAAVARGARRRPERRGGDSRRLRALRRLCSAARTSATP